LASTSPICYLVYCKSPAAEATGSLFGGSWLVGLTFQAQSFSLRPKVWTQGDHLYARTPYTVQALSLFAFARQIHVDGKKRIIEIEDVRFWLFRRVQTIPFDRVAYIDPRHSDLGTSRGWAGYGCWARTDKLENFTVSLVLRRPDEEVRLFRFAEGGTAQSGGFGSVCGDSDPLADSHGELGDHVRFFVEKLQQFLKVPVGGTTGPIPDDKTGVQYECSICKRPSLASRDTCWICGSPVQAIIPALSEPPTTKPKAGQTDGALLDLDFNSDESPVEETLNAND
jgi:hypothetical protein